MKFEIKNRWTGNVQYSCELDAEFAGKSINIKLGAAVNMGYKSGAVLRDADLSGAVLRDAYLRGADLSRADLSGAYLRGADLSGANLRDADLSRAVLSRADLSGADLRDADLSGAVLRGADLRDADLSRADLSGADLRDAVLSGVPKIPNIHRAIYEAASKPGALDMGVWHGACDTTHCRAGWVITLAGDAGKAMEFCMGTAAAAALIYLASDPKIEKIPDFYDTDENSLANMKQLADKEASAV